MNREEFSREELHTNQAVLNFIFKLRSIYKETELENFMYSKAKVDNEGNLYLKLTDEKWYKVYNTITERILLKNVPKKELVPVYPILEEKVKNLKLSRMKVTKVLTSHFQERITLFVTRKNGEKYRVQLTNYNKPDMEFENLLTLTVIYKGMSFVTNLVPIDELEKNIVQFVEQFDKYKLDIEQFENILQHLKLSKYLFDEYNDVNDIAFYSKYNTPITVFDCYSPFAESIILRGHKTDGNKVQVSNKYGISYTVPSDIDRDSFNDILVKLIEE